jgi:RNA polymerase sigma-70 factor (ECF subfamily)
MVEGVNEWFVREILCHEAALRRYVLRAWPNPSDVPDICHDVYVRIYESAAGSLPQSPRSFLFTTARHLMIDRARRSRIVSIELIEDLDALNVLIDPLSPERRLTARQQLQHLSVALNGLPRQCREVLWLQRVEGLSQQEIGSRLDIAVATVQKHALKGIRRLAELFYGGAQTGPGEQQRNVTSESAHGK